jgi:hypothetical protein
MLEIQTSTDGRFDSQKVSIDNSADIERFAGVFTFLNRVGNTYTFVNDHSQLTIESDDDVLKNLIVGEKYMLRK